MADNGESDDDAAVDPSDISEDTRPATFSDAVQSWHTPRVYLEENGCQDYGRLYDLADQIYDINRQNIVQKTVTDYFSRI